MKRTAVVTVVFALAAAGTLWVSPQPAKHPAPFSAPPVAMTEPRVLAAHGEERVDDYYWMRDRNNPAVLAYLRAENAYSASRLEPLKPLIATLEGELRSRAEGADTSPPFAENRFIYRRRMAKGASHPTIVRRPAGKDATEQVVLDVERLAVGHTYYDVAEYVVSPDGNRVAFAVDQSGARMHRIFIRDIASGMVSDTGIANVSSDLVFSADSQWLFYVRAEANSLRANQLWRHAVGQPQAADQLVYEEQDPTFELHLTRSRSGRYVLLTSSQQQSSEVRYLPTDKPHEPLRIMEPRRSGVTYSADHVGGSFYVRTNLDAPDFRLVQAPEHAPGAENWSKLIGETPGRIITDFELFDSFVALLEESEANQTVRVYRFTDQRFLPVPVPEKIGVTEITRANGNRNADAATLRVRFAGPNHPEMIYDFDTRTGAMTVQKQARAWDWFQAERYAVERLSIVASDGEAVPVTVTYRRDLRRPGGNPALLTAYGAYGSSVQPGFPETWLSLIDRGFVFAHVHVRGGQEKGTRWYDQGRVLHKSNSFSDFIAATEAMIARGYADRERVFARGGSAGGLLVAVAANRRPDLYAGVVAEVPFVDVLTTMSDPGLPLTTLEYQEWGDPANDEHYEAMRAYSPYDNVTSRAMPPMLVTAALNDSQVGFHEPAKWVARMRAARNDSNELLLVTNMKAGHQGTPGRFGSNSEDATILAWLLARAGLPRSP